MGWMKITSPGIQRIYIFKTYQDFFLLPVIFFGISLSLGFFLRGEEKILWIEIIDGFLIISALAVVVLWFSKASCSMIYDSSYYFLFIFPPLFSAFFTLLTWLLTVSQTPLENSLHLSHQRKWWSVSLRPPPIPLQLTPSHTRTRIHTRSRSHTLSHTRTHCPTPACPSLCTLPAASSRSSTRHSLSPCSD